MQFKIDHFSRECDQSVGECEVENKNKSVFCLSDASHYLVTMAGSRPRKFPLSDQAHPFSLLSLIQSQASSVPGLRSGQVKVVKPLTSETDFSQQHLTASDDLYRLPNYQSQPADLSLHSEQFDSPQNLYFRQLSAGGGASLPQYEGYYGGGGGGGEEQSYDSYQYPAADSFQEQYARSLYNGYEENSAASMARGPDPGSRLYEFPDPSSGQTPPAGGCKPDLASDPGYRYPDQFPPTVPLLPPPLHPSPAVLLHIKYVMESVCESMGFTDVTIITQSDTLRAHRSILSAHSTFLDYILSTNTNTELGEDPVIVFPNYSSLYARMLLQFFYTGEVTTMTQKDIEPLREICFSLGISSLMTRLDDVKLSISFQNISSYDTNIPSVDQDESKPDEDLVRDTSKLHPPLPQLETPSADLDKPSRIAAESKILNEDPPPSIASCKFQESRDKQRIVSKDLDSLDSAPTRRYTVVSKMPKNTNLQVSEKCPKCDMRFYKPEILADHLKLHEGIRPKECSICKKTFTTNYHLTTHMRIHTGQKPYSCSFKGCGKDFSDSSSLRRHQKIHTGHKSYCCKKCGKEFTDRSSGIRHERTHGEDSKPLFRCNFCEKSFSRKSQLKKHKLKSHPAVDTESEIKKLSENKIFECKKCKAVFRTQSKLDQHTRVHTGDKSFKCDKCDKAFSRKTNLQLHIRTHTGEKPHACARCGRCFSDVSAFRRHCRTHSGERPYTCGNCGSKFTQASTLNNHKRSCRQTKTLADECDKVGSKLAIKSP